MWIHLQQCPTRGSKWITRNSVITWRCGAMVRNTNWNTVTCLPRSKSWKFSSKIWPGQRLLLYELERSTMLWTWDNHFQSLWNYLPERKGNNCSNASQLSLANRSKISREQSPSPSWKSARALSFSRFGGSYLMASGLKYPSSMVLEYESQHWPEQNHTVL